MGNKAQAIKTSIFCERDGSRGVLRNFPGVTRCVHLTRGIQLSVSISADVSDCNGRQRVDFIFLFFFDSGDVRGGSIDLSSAGVHVSGLKRLRPAKTAKARREAHSRAGGLS